MQLPESELWRADDGRSRAQPGRYHRVILDLGDEAFVISRATTSEPRPGDLLEWRGRPWRIARYRAHAKAWVAHPVWH